MWKERNDDSECWSELRLKRKWTKETKEGGEHRELNQLRTFVDCDDLSRQWMFSNYCPDKRLREESYSAAVDTCGIEGGRRFRWAPHNWCGAGEAENKGHEAGEQRVLMKFQKESPSGLEELVGSPWFCHKCVTFYGWAWSDFTWNLTNPVMDRVSGTLVLRN